jgi:hypothetical protein
MKEKGKFRIRSKRFFLTYPKVIDLPNLEELFLKAMEEAFEIISKKEMKYVIVKELHADGTPHLHVFLEFPAQRHIYSRDKLHVKLIDTDGKVVVQEGKYESVRSAGLVIAYILKSSSGDYLSNMHVPIVDGVVYTDAEEHLYAILESNGYEAATNTLITTYKKLASKKASTIVRNLRTVNKIMLQKKYKENNSIRNMEDFIVPEEVLDWKANLFNKKSLVLYGPSGTGKTEFCKSLFKSMNFDTFFVRDINSLADKQMEENTALLFDDISLANKSREEKIHMYDLENNSQIRVLYGIAYLPAGTPRAFTTNKIDRLVGTIDLNAVPEEISRRLVLVNIKKSLKISMKFTAEIEISDD